MTGIDEHWWIYPLLGFLLTAALLIPAKYIALHLKFVDRPGGRKQHVEPVPPIGGLVFIPVFMILAHISGLGVTDYPYFYGAVTLLWLTGAIDDRFRLSAIIKLSVQFLAAGLIVFGDGAMVTYLGNLFGLGDIWLGLVAPVFTILCVVLLINAINMLDGLDGLAGGTGLIMLCWLIIGAAIYGGGHIISLPLLILSCVLLGFLLHNMQAPGRKQAGLFMGDAGSTCLGLILAWAVIHLSQSDPLYGDAAITPITVAWILALPVYDALSLFAYRLSQKRNPFSPDRRHAHYLLRDAGYSIGRSVAIIHILVFISCILGLLAAPFGAPPLPFMIGWIALFIAHILLTFGVWRIPQVAQSS